MLAVRTHDLTGPDSLRQETVPIPLPAETQVLVRVYCVCVNPVDVYLCKGTHSCKPALPFTPGRDGSGIVVDVGSKVATLKRGDRVFFTRSTSGCYAEYAVVNSAYVFPLHKNLTFQEGSCLGSSYFTAYRALITKGKAKYDEAILVHGTSGGIGIAICQLARAYNMKVYGIAKTNETRNLMKQNGAQMALREDDTDYPEKIMQITDNKGVDVVLAANAETSLQDVIPLLTKHGRCVMIGSRGGVTIDPRDIIQKEISLIGVNRAVTTEDEWKDAEKAILHGVGEGWVRPPITREFTLAEACEAHKTMSETDGLVTLRLCAENDLTHLDIGPTMHSNGHINQAFKITTEEHLFPDTSSYI